MRQSGVRWDPALLVLFALTAIFFEIRISRLHAPSNCNDAFMDLRRALEASEKALVSEKRASARAIAYEKSLASANALAGARAEVMAAADAPTDLFGCTPPKHVRLAAGCWQPAATGVYTGPKVVNTGREYMRKGNSQRGEDQLLLEKFFFGRRVVASFSRWARWTGLRTPPRSTSRSTWAGPES